MLDRLPGCFGHWLRQLRRASDSRKRPHYGPATRAVITVAAKTRFCTTNRRARWDGRTATEAARRQGEVRADAAHGHTEVGRTGADRRGPATGGRRQRRMLAWSDGLGSATGQVPHSSARYWSTLPLTSVRSPSAWSSASSESRSVRSTWPNASAIRSRPAAVAFQSEAIAAGGSMARRSAAIWRKASVSEGSPSASDRAESTRSSIPAACEQKPARPSVAFVPPSLCPAEAVAAEAPESELPPPHADSRTTATAPAAPTRNTSRPWHTVRDMTSSRNGGN